MANYLNKQHLENCIEQYHQTEKALLRAELILDAAKDKAKRLKRRNGSVKELMQAQEAQEKAHWARRNSHNDLAACILLLADGLLMKYRPTFIDPEDVVQEIVLYCLQTAIPKYDPKRSCAFNYLSTCIRNVIFATYRKETIRAKGKYQFLNEHRNDRDKYRV